MIVLGAAGSVVVGTRVSVVSDLEGGILFAKATAADVTSDSSRRYQLVPKAELNDVCGLVVGAVARTGGCWGKGSLVGHARQDMVRRKAVQDSVGLS